MSLLTQAVQNGTNPNSGNNSQISQLIEMISNQQQDKNQSNSSEGYRPSHNSTSYQLSDPTQNQLHGPSRLNPQQATSTYQYQQHPTNAAPISQGAQNLMYPPSHNYGNYIDQNTQQPHISGNYGAHNPNLKHSSNDIGVENQNQQSDPKSFVNYGALHPSQLQSIVPGNYGAQNSSQQQNPEQNHYGSRSQQSSTVGAYINQNQQFNSNISHTLPSNFEAQNISQNQYAPVQSQSGGYIQMNQAATSNPRHQHQLGFNLSETIPMQNGAFQRSGRPEGSLQDEYSANLSSAPLRYQPSASSGHQIPQSRSSNQMSMNPQHSGNMSNAPMPNSYPQHLQLNNTINTPHNYVQPMVHKAGGSGNEEAKQLEQLAKMLGRR